MQNDLQGINQLTKEGILGVVNLIESMHQRIYSLGGMLNQGNVDQTSGLTRLIYQSIRFTTRLSVKGVDFALSKFTPVLPSFQTDRQRNQWVSILNGILGDHLASTNNPLALGMTWFHEGMEVTPEQMAQKLLGQKSHPILLIHGLCMNDQQWLRNGHDHGIQLQKNKQMMPIYVRYNSGLNIYQNGRQLALMLERFFNKTNDRNTMNILCHSMGGLVMRSAMYAATENKQKWLNKINKVIFLGTPHQGAVLEKTGHFVDYLISINPYSAPFTKLTHIRSQGIRNLRLGSVWKDHETIQLPKQVNCFAIAANHKDSNTGSSKLIGDGLVSVNSALGNHHNSKKVVFFKPQNKMTINDVSHMGLLSAKKVYQQLTKILST